MAQRVTIDTSTVLSRSNEPVTTDIDGSVVMMSLGRAKYYGLDAIGTRVWELLATPRSVAVVRDTLLAEYDVDRESCERDVLDLLQDMLEEDLICVHHEASS